LCTRGQQPLILVAVTSSQLLLQNGGR
jgi:hypothetical protein